MDFAEYLRVSRARPIEPDGLWFVTARCHRRLFRLVPRRWLVQLLEYLLAVATLRFGVLPVAIYVASNHYHLVLADPDGRLPDFTQWFNSLLARFVNVVQGESDAVWSRAGPHCAPLPDAGGVESAIVYSLSNPVKDGLVAHGRDWPGLRTCPQDWWRRPRVIERPRRFFSDKGALPDRATLRWHVPRTHGEMSPSEFGHRIAARLGEVEAAHRARHEAAGRTPAGALAVISGDYEQRTRSPEPRGPGTGPSEVIAGDPATHRAALRRLEGFREAYVGARSQWLGGNRSVVWPCGTWQMYRRHNVRRHPPPPGPAGPTSAPNRRSAG
ncbi:MAG: putative transposase [Myxococcota bacterium]|jgi:putative transposase